jgi:mannose-6-phosphate isomerase-like protein (cupin superfamily)
MERQEHSDRWSKDLVGTEGTPTTAGFSLGVAEYHAQEFGPLQTHDDQEALYVVSGEGQVRVGDALHCVRPGVALYVPPNTVHATRRTGERPVKVVYAHGAV